MVLTQPGADGAYASSRRPDHQPVLLAETLELLAPERGGHFVDCTLGLGGHGAALLERSPTATLLGIDRDPAALARAAERLACFGDRVTLVEARFDQLGEIAESHRLPPLAGLLADLGISSLQLDTPHRGFSFRFEAPLDMRMGEGNMTASDIVNGWAEEELARVLRENGEERDARRIARAIVAARPIESTTQLRAVVASAKRVERGARIDPATRVFQALRIEVNEELSSLESMLDQATRLLDVDGRLVVISYHSLEDRIVKNRLRDLARGSADPVTGRTIAETRLLELLTKKPVRPSAAEVDRNPRSRSALLRAARRIDDGRG